MRGHGRYAYSALPSRPPLLWPGGKRLACYVAVNVEAFPFGEGLGVPLANPLPEPDVQNYGWRDWGNRVGVWYILDALEEARLPAAALLNTAVYDLCPEVAAAFRARGDEIVGHGRTNAERQSGMGEDEERALIRDCRDRVAREEGGAPPEGWLGPWVAQTERTPDLLAEAGFRYTLDWPHDDQPAWLATAHGPLVAVPYARPVNDMPALHGAKWPPEVWANAVLDQLEEMVRLSARFPGLVFNLSLHPFLAGWPFRLRQLRRILARLDELRDEAWLCRPRDVARAFSAATPGPAASAG